jgi:hypothetical protein
MSHLGSEIRIKHTKSSAALLMFLQPIGFLVSTTRGCSSLFGNPIAMSQVLTAEEFFNLVIIAQVARNSRVNPAE